MASKTRFNKSNQGLGSSLVGGSTRGNAKSGPGGSGFGTAVAGAKAPAHVQVIYNGKIVTPVSMLAKPKAIPGLVAAVNKEGAEETKASGPRSGEVAPVAEAEDKMIAGKSLSKKDSMTNNRAR